MNRIIYFVAIIPLIFFNSPIIEAFIGQTKLPTFFDTISSKIPNFSKVPNVPKPQIIHHYQNDDQNANGDDHDDDDDVVEENEKLNQTEIECKTGKCYTINECFSEFGEKDFELCSLPNKAKGVCCSINESETLSDDPSQINIKLLRKPTDTINLSPHENRIIVNNAAKTAMDFITKMEKLEHELFRRKLIPRKGSETYSHQGYHGKNTEASKLARIGLINLETTKGLVKHLKLNSSQDKTGFPQIDVSRTSISNMCPKEPICRTSKYRTADGSCNNLNYKSWGKALTPFNRLINPNYADGFDKPRVAMDGYELPNARQISLRIATEKNYLNHKFNFLALQFGQFIDHDMTRTAGTRTYDNSEIACCGQEFVQNPHLLHPSCMPIIFSQQNGLPQRGKPCIEYVRSAVAPRDGCKLGAREQMNQNSAFIDGGMIYGTSEEQSKEIRLYRYGKLKTSYVDNREFLPYMNSSGSCSIAQNMNEKCFTAGDGRVNLIYPLVVLHAVFLSEHNRIAGILLILNPRWNDEALYQEARRIVIAELQHIVFKELLQVLIGCSTMKRNRLTLKKNGYSYNYSPDVDPSIVSVFATAAFRYHSAVPRYVNLQDSEDKIIERKRLLEQFFDPSIFYLKGAFEALIYGISNQPIQYVDPHFADDLTNHLFQNKGEPWGLDLIAINMQRGRDHGTDGYNAWRELCGLQRINSFEELDTIFVSPLCAYEMRLLYRHVDDIDLFIAGVCEKHLPDSIIGPTFACIIGEQFRRIKEGDRFWYENGGLESSFTPQQLQEIRKVSLARVLCDNSYIIKMQRLAMVQSSNWNPKLSCKSSDILHMDLNYWRSYDGKQTVDEKSFERPINTDDKQNNN